MKTWSISIVEIDEAQTHGRTSAWVCTELLAQEIAERLSVLYGTPLSTLFPVTAAIKISNEAVILDPRPEEFE